MATECRLLKGKKCKITQKYVAPDANHHGGIDIVGADSKSNSITDYIVAHSSGTVVAIRNKCNKTYSTYNAAVKDWGDSYGNYVLIKHSSKCYTMYAHLMYNSVQVKKGDKVSKGQVIGYMGNTGHSSGAHLHFEFRTRESWTTRKDPTKYLNSDLPLPPKLANAGLYYGMKGEQVGYLQKDLNYVIKAGLKVDKSFGPAVLKSLKAYQSKSGLVVDGKYGLKTQAQMKKDLV